MLFDGIWYTPESQLCHTPKEKRPETPRESGRYIWWSWRELNPRPKFLHPRYYMLSQSLHSPGTCGRTRHYQTSLIRFNASTPGRASTRSLLGLTSLDPRPKSGG